MIQFPAFIHSLIFYKGVTDKNRIKERLSLRERSVEEKSYLSLINNIIKSGSDIMEKRNVIAKAAAAPTNGDRRVLATVPSVEEEHGCDCPHRLSDEGASSAHYVEHYCGYKREYPHR